ncbi:hypothetical protein GCM10009544_30250 [Streptomyces stramineus]|uniref:Uncharacterized protein n=1 Tax=Streptomyces stramineus TaxID=173861 RepID=A0ABN1A2D6_9ACTN
MGRESYRHALVNDHRGRYSAHGVAAGRGGGRDVEKFQTELTLGKTAKIGAGQTCFRRGVQAPGRGSRELETPENVVALGR